MLARTEPTRQLRSYSDVICLNMPTAKCAESRVNTGTVIRRPDFYFCRPPPRVGGTRKCFRRAVCKHSLTLTLKNGGIVADFVFMSLGQVFGCILLCWLFSCILTWGRYGFLFGQSNNNKSPSMISRAVGTCVDPLFCFVVSIEEWSDQVVSAAVLNSVILAHLL